jgi:hypothetical protein
MSVVIAAAMLTIAAAHEASAAKAHGHRRTTAKAAAGKSIAADAATSAAIVAALESCPPTLFAQPVAVVTGREKGSIRVTIETPPQGALTGSGKGTKLASGTFGTDGGEIATYPDHMPPSSEKADPNLTQAAVSACRTLFADHALTTAFVIVVQPAGTRYDVIYSPIPYVESQTRVVPVTVALPATGTGQPQTQLPPALPAPAEKGAATADAPAKQASPAAQPASPSAQPAVRNSRSLTGPRQSDPA